LLVRCLLVPGLLLPLLLHGQWTPLATGDVRSLALGGNGVAADAVHALWRNPAGYAQATSVALYAGVEWRYGLRDLRAGNVGAVLPGGWGIGLTHFALEGFTESRLEAGYGRRLGKRWTGGITAIGLRQRQPLGTGEVTFSTGAGVQYTASSSVRLGVYTGNPLGRGPIPRRLVIGGRYRPAESIILSAEWRAAAGRSQFASGLAYRPVGDIELLLGLVTDPAMASLGFRYTFGRTLSVSGVTIHHTELGSTPAFGLWYVPSAQEPSGENGVQ
jgi:hypothetical protein